MNERWTFDFFYSTLIYLIDPREEIVVWAAAHI